MKYMVLMIIVITVAGILIFGELNFDSPEYRIEMQAAARQTLVVVGTQAQTIAAMQSTVDASIPMQTQYVANMREQDALMGTQDAILNGTVVVPTPTPRPQPTVAQSGVAPPSANNGSSAYADSTLASSITTAGCASGRTEQFEITGPGDATQVYFVTRARNVQPGQVFQTRWFPNSDPMEMYDSVTWTADAGYGETCVYFWIESTDIPFSIGMWTVELLVNGQTVHTATFEFCEVGWCT